jgi:LuxR family transcriptional regulator, maltose regulon positive regulatory protein
MPRSENQSTAKVINNTLYHSDGGLIVGSAEWFAWLNQAHHRLFYVEVNEGTFTARKEPGPSRFSGKYSWYAYRSKGMKLYKAYIGQSEELTLQRLSDVARQLAEQMQS